MNFIKRAFAAPGFDGEESEAIPEDDEEGRHRPGPAGLCASHLPAAPGLQLVRGGVPQAPKHDVDHEADVALAGERDFPLQQTQPGKDGLLVFATLFLDFQTMHTSAEFSFVVDGPTGSNYVLGN
eukprot:scaffold177025_cov29-Prasinocladus_malaysianus.AAC.1